MSIFISIIIPNYNGEKTLPIALQSLSEIKYKGFEVIVVDDASDDKSVSIIKRYSCRWHRFSQNKGASAARNQGAKMSKGKILFFIDADCVLEEKVLLRALEIHKKNGKDIIIGGTYKPLSYDRSFFSDFQSIFINYSEIKNRQNPDYIATHAMVIDKKTFLKYGGFPEKFLPILEDVAYSHRMKKNGLKLMIDRNIVVEHIFNFNFFKSMKNAFKKSYYWTIYSIKNRDLLSDSGTASWELKINTVILIFSCFGIPIAIAAGMPILLILIGLAWFINFTVNRKLFKSYLQNGNALFAFKALLYYLFLYPWPVAAGAFWGFVNSSIMDESGYK